MADYASANARMLLPLGLTDSEFARVMGAMFERLFQRVSDEALSLARWEDDGGAAEQIRAMWEVPRG